jgi:4-amino-4-deoxy-L-arabinose transferase-like glycosyltransferase
LKSLIFRLGLKKKRGRRDVLPIILAALVITMVLFRVVNMQLNPVLHTSVIMDEGRNSAVARNLALKGVYAYGESLQPNGLCLAKAFDVGPLTVLSMYSSFSIFGVGYWQERLLGAIFGMLTVLLVYLCGRKIYSENAARIAAVVTGLDPLFSFYNRVALHDTLSYFLMMLSLYAYILALERKDRTALLAATGAIAGAASLARYNGAFILGVIVIFHLLRERKHPWIFARDLAIMALSCAAVLLFAVALIASMGPGYFDSFYTSFTATVHISGIAAEGGSLALTAEFFMTIARTAIYYYPFMISLSVIGLISVWRAGKLTGWGKHGKLVAIWIVVGFIWWMQSYMTGKYSLIYGIPLFMLFGWIADANLRIPSRRKLTIIALVCMASFYVFTNLTYLYDFRDDSIYKVSQKISSLDSRVYHAESEIGFISGVSLFPAYWPNSTMIAKLNVQEWGFNMLYDPPLTETFDAYMARTGTQPKYILLSRITKGIGSTPKKEFRKMVQDHGTLIYQEGPYNIYELDWNSTKETKIEYAPLEGDFLSYMKKLLQTR